MDGLISTFTDFWNWLSSVVPDNVLKCLIALSLMCLFYFLFLRWIFCLFGSKTVTKMIDWLFFIVCIATIIYFVAPSININHYNYNVENTTSAIVETVEPVIIGG